MKNLLLMLALSVATGLSAMETLIIEPETFSGKGRIFTRKEHGLSNDNTYGKWGKITKKVKLEKEGKYYIWIRYYGNWQMWSQKMGPQARTMRDFCFAVNGKRQLVNQMDAIMNWLVFPQKLVAGENILELEKVGVDPYVDQIIITPDRNYLPSFRKHRDGQTMVDDKIIGRTGLPVDSAIVIPKEESSVIVENFVPLRGNTLKYQTQVTAFHDCKNVYFSFICEQPQATLKVDRGRIYNDDSVELVIDADREMKNIWHLIVNSKGEVFSEKIQSQVSSPWETGWKCDVNVKPGHWIVNITVSIPDIMNRFPEHPGYWRVNFCRYICDSEEWSSWKKTDGFTNARHLGELRLADIGENEIGAIYRPVLEKKIKALGKTISEKDVELADYEIRTIEKNRYMPPDGVSIYFERMNLIPNPGFEYASIINDQLTPFNWLATGNGNISLASEAKQGRYSLAVNDTDNNFSLAANVRPFVDYAKKYEWTLWCKSIEATGNNYLQIDWLGHDPDKPGWNALKKIGNNKYPLNPGDKWQKEKFSVQPPLGAMNCKFFIHSNNNKGTILLDAFEFDGIGAQDVDFLMPQSGYDVHGSKNMLIWSKNDNLKDFKLVQNDKIAFQGSLKKYPDSHWGRHCYSADFSAVVTPGDYVIRINDVSSHEFKIVKGLYLDLAQYASGFYFVQRQGIDVPGWHKANFLDDAAIYDTKTKKIIGHRDVSGGWQDAGDPSKQATDDYSIYGLAEFYENLKPQWNELGEKYPDILALNWWGVKRFIEKCHVGDGLFMGFSVGNRPNQKSIHKVDPANWTDNIPGNEDDRIINERSSIGWTVSHLAKFAVAIRPLDQTLSDRIVKIVIANHQHRRMMQHGPPHYPASMKQDENFKIIRHDAEIMRTAMHLHTLTGQEEYRLEAEKYCRNVTALLAKIFTFPPGHRYRGSNQSHDWRWNSFALATSLFEYLRYYSDTPLKEEIQKALRNYVDTIIQYAKTNEFGVITSLDSSKTLQFEAVGRNTAICAYGYIAALAGNLFKNNEYLEFAENAAQWVLGRNPSGISMLIGKGWKFAATSSMVAALSPGHGDGVIPGVIRGIGHGGEPMPEGYPALNIAFQPGGKAQSNLHEIFQLDTIMFILLCQEIHKTHYVLNPK